ncbi:hypothetical protein HanRHA438_Chr16g0775761 [Helianthus annuus]|nr:hypothetical protein HanRHA438_Chr16g0775761 [Helianthus annuus]
MAFPCFRGFGHLLFGHTNILKHNLGLLEALCTFYDHANFCFKFNKNVRIHYGLLDILFITGLNIDGGDEESTKKIWDMFKDFIAIPEGEVRRCDVKKIKHFAWGAGMLAAFHYSIRSYLSLGKSQFHGPLLPFVVFLCEMIPDFAKMIGLKEHFTQTEFPLMKQWTEKLYHASLNTHKEHKPTKEDYVKFFSELKSEQVCKPRPSSYPRTREAANICSCCDCTGAKLQYGGTELSPHKSKAI